MQPESDFARTFSIETTRPNAEEVAALKAILPPGTPVYLTAVPTRTPEEVIAAAARVRKAGLEPVPHIAARRLVSKQVLAERLAALTGEAGVRRLLVIGGDVEPAGPFTDALAVIQRGCLREAGIEEIGIGAYPEGHPRVPPARLAAALDEKIATTLALGLRIHLVSQFSFSAEQIIAWLRRIRTAGINWPVKVGLAGPTSVPALMRFARRCGVNASLRGLMSGAAAGLIGQTMGRVMGPVGPDRIIAALAEADGLGDIAPHYFSFGGPIETARYACQAAAETRRPSSAMAQH